ALARSVPRRVAADNSEPPDRVAAGPGRQDHPGRTPACAFLTAIRPLPSLPRSTPLERSLRAPDGIVAPRTLEPAHSARRGRPRRPAPGRRTAPVADPRPRTAAGGRSVRLLPAQA